jgi:opacity protein-like surface antigen
MMDDRQSNVSGMGGVGMSFRARPVPHFALDIGIDAIGGRDYLGNKRSETPFMLSAFVYANPRNPVQFYMIGGLGWSAARVEYESTNGNTPEIQHYSYFGGHLGAGLEFRLNPGVSLNIDMLGFVRGRTDSLARTQPEFTDPTTGRTTNTSGGGLFRGGVTFYW